MARLIKADALHTQLADAIRDDIANGTYAAGDLLPSEKAMAANYKVSHTTVRRALLALRAEGLVEVRNGKGAYVRPGHDGPPVVVERGTKNRPALTAITEPQRRADVPADVLTAALLGIESGQPLFTAEVLCTEAGTERTVIVRTALPYTVAEGTPLQGDPYGDHQDVIDTLIQAFGKLITSEYVRAAMPTPQDSRALGQADITPVIETTTVWAARGKALYAQTERRSGEGVALHYPL